MFVYKKLLYRAYNYALNIKINCILLIMEAYAHKKKIKLANKIGKIKKKSDYIQIYGIIGNDANAVENSSGLHMFFHKLTNDTYYKIEEKLKEFKRRDSDLNTIDTLSSDNYTDRKEYKPYVEDEFPSQKDISPKLKFSNKEKSIIKRRRYNKNISSEQDVDSNIIYTKFDINASDSDTIQNINTI